MAEIRRDENTFPEYVPNLPDLVEHRGWWIGLGVALTVLGFIALGSAMATTFFTAGILGMFLLFGGIIQAIHAFWVRKWSGFLVSLLTGAFLIFAGIFTLNNPIASLAALTMLLAVFFMASGIVKSVYAMTHKFGNGVWMFFSGLVSIFLGILIWTGWPASSLYTLGIFLGADLLFMGATWIAIGISAGHFKHPPHREAF